MARLNVVEKMKRVGSIVYFELSNGDRFGRDLSLISEATYPNGTYKGMVVDGTLIPTTILEMRLVNIWKNMLQEQ
jgi:hypothetical protein